jgi:hypothetical protein
VDSAGTAPVQGTFDRVPEGATITADGVQLVVSYRGGDGNDVTLTRGSRSGGAGRTGVAAVASALSGGGRPWPLAAALLAFGAGLVLVLKRRRRSS